MAQSITRRGYWNNIDWPWICSRRMHVFSTHIFSKHVFSKRMFSTFCLFINVTYFWKYGFFLETRAGVTFSPLCASMVLCSIRESGPWGRNWQRQMRYPSLQSKSPRQWQDVRSGRVGGAPWLCELSQTWGGTTPGSCSASTTVWSYLAESQTTRRPKPRRNSLLTAWKLNRVPSVEGKQERTWRVPVLRRLHGLRVLDANSLHWGHNPLWQSTVAYWFRPQANKETCVLRRFGLSLWSRHPAGCVGVQPREVGFDHRKFPI